MVYDAIIIGAGFRIIMPNKVEGIHQAVLSGIAAVTDISNTL